MKRNRPADVAAAEGDEAAAATVYEQMRLKRMKENMERMSKLGIMDLAKKVNEKKPEKKVKREPSVRKTVLPSSDPPRRSSRMEENMERMNELGIIDLANKIKEKPSPKKKVKRGGLGKKTVLPSSDPPRRSSSKVMKRGGSEKKTVLTSSNHPRRSSRLVTLLPVSYTEKRVMKEKKEKIVKISIPKGSMPEIYTKEDEELLGDCKEAWTLNVDGYSEDGERIYDPFNGKSCHQCRQKTLGHRTKCSKCKSFHGQFCGDCLYTRYGENVLEANQNTEWICPVCRGICNCSRCRRIKGWAPTGQLYGKVKQLGFNSVAHYLIKTRQVGSDLEKLDAELVALESDIPNQQTGRKGDVAENGDDDYNEDEENNNLDSDQDLDGATDDEDDDDDYE